MELQSINDDINEDTIVYKLNKQINYNILFNLLYRYNINIDNSTNNIINKYYNLNEIEEPYNSLFQKYMIYDTNNNLFWITLSLYFILHIDLYEFMLSLFNISKQCEIYNCNYYYNDLKNKNKNELIYILKEYIEISNLHMLCFLNFFLQIFN